MLDDHPAQLVHEAAIALDLGGDVEVLREHEVQVAVERVAEDDRVGVAVLGQQALQVERGLGEPLHREGDVLDDDRGADAAHRAHRREQALAHVPEARALGGSVGKAHRLVRVHARRAPPRSRRICAASVARIGRARLDQQRRAVGPERARAFGQARLALDRAQRGAVGQLDRRHRRAFSSVTARHAVSRSSNRMSALALSAYSGTVV